MGCEADISDLKGYHRRHRVCLRCANASSVNLDGEEKRYCQQCGKFHALLDFDEGKRSCRRKLERHNKRRRRKPADSNSVAAKENAPEGEAVEDIILCTDQRQEITIGSASKDVDNVANNMVIDGKTFWILMLCISLLAVYCLMCPTGRMSFKLYDWNPAEFPRRLRHQIFQWLSSMPVELEGYIRPGCTILTIFIAMPPDMWDKLYQDGALRLKQLIQAPESLLLGRGNILIYLSNMIVHVLKDGTSLVNVKMEIKAPKLHFVYPKIFEAGNALEFIACGSNLDQPNLRFLVSFSGKYLVCDAYRVASYGNVECYNEKLVVSEIILSKEMFRVTVKQTPSGAFGPAFIEVENESGISNFYSYTHWRQASVL
ncbi:hypothetical protein HPP92_006956 [Vanilla planifolia]|uniref:SBP-type domain-containing protein n=1 Tax=Vanilla planifolia TaxID=51239 RepID=A0A835RHA1_VANPL|nr:hypothetical protein HPP92_006956 [Vanilla planifolia]